ncbi:MAG: hypothetical protein ACM3QW_10060 [Ignavibacteriales bacterium]
MRKKIMILGMAVTLLCLAIGGATFALFTDGAATNSKVIASGTVDIDSYRDGFDTIPGPMFYTTPEEGKTPTDPSYNGLKPTGLWVPGDTQIRSLIVYNQGSLDAVLDQVSAQIISDDSNMAEHMNVAVYKVLPRCLPNGAPFAPLPGDDTMDQDTLNQTSNLINPFILMCDHFFDVDEFTQALIEHQVDVHAQMLWSGNLTDLIADSQTMSSGIDLKSNGNPFIKRGCLLAFVVHMDGLGTDNGHQAGTAKFGFTVGARQAANI